MRLRKVVSMILILVLSISMFSMVYANDMDKVTDNNEEVGKAEVEKVDLRQLERDEVNSYITCEYNRDTLNNIYDSDNNYKDPAIREDINVLIDDFIHPKQVLRAYTVTLYINDVEYTLDVYGNGYMDIAMYKIRDIGYILNGTECQFNIEWNKVNNIFNLSTNTPYKEIGEELELKTDRTEFIQLDYVARYNISVDNKLRTDFTVIYVNGEPYVYISHLSNILGLQHYWDYENSIASIESKVLRDRNFITRDAKYSDVKLDYDYNIFVHNKGYIDFSDGEPFLADDGHVYVPAEEYILQGRDDVFSIVLDEAKGELSVGNRKPNKDGEIYGEQNFSNKTNDIWYGINFKEVGYLDYETDGIYYDYYIIQEEPYSYEPLKDRFCYSLNETVVNTLSSDYVATTECKATQWYKDFKAKDPYNKYYILLYNGDRIRNEFDITKKTCITEVELDSYDKTKKYGTDFSLKIIDGVAYYPVENMDIFHCESGIFVEKDKTVYVGDTNYKAELMKERVLPYVIEDEFFNNGKSCEENMIDLFKNVEKYEYTK